MKGLFLYDSHIFGPTTLVVGMMHGNEPIWKYAHRLVRQAFKWHLFVGKIIFLIGNPEATTQNIRFIDQDLNRSFGEYTQTNIEILRAHEIKQYIKDLGKIDFVFDIHSTPTQSDPMIICTQDSESQALSQYFPFPYVINGLVERIEGISLTHYMSTLGACGLAFECGSHYDTAGHSLVRSIFEVILQIQNGQIPEKNTSQTSVRVTDTIRTSSKDFQFLKPYRWFENIPAFEAFARELTKEHFFDQDTILVIPRPDALLELDRKSEVIVGYVGESV